MKPGSAAGTLTVVATSLGNAADLSPRAAAVLREADVVVAEDTRSARQLLAGVGAGAGQRVLSCLDANERMCAVADGRRGEAAAAGREDPQHGGKGLRHLNALPRKRHAAEIHQIDTGIGKFPSIGKPFQVVTKIKPIHPAGTFIARSAFALLAARAVMT